MYKRVAYKTKQKELKREKEHHKNMDSYTIPFTNIVYRIYQINCLEWYFANDFLRRENYKYNV